MKAKGFAASALAMSAAAMMTLGGCGGVDPNATAAVLNGRNISAGLLNFAAQKEAVNYDTYYMPYYGTDMWTSDPENDGSTMTDDIRSDALDELKDMYLLEEHMGDYNVTISQEDETAMNAAVDSFFAENTANALNKMGATKDIVKEYLRLETIQKKVGDAIRDTADKEVSDEEAAQTTISYYNIVVPEDEDSEEEDSEAMKVAKDLLAEQVVTAAKVDFDKVEDDYGLTKLTLSFGMDDESEDANMIAAVKKLSEGEVSDLVKTEDEDYWVIRLDSEFDREATDEKKEEIVSDRQSDLYSEKLSEYSDAATWETKDDVIKKINFNTLYQMAYDEEATETAG